MIHGGAPPPFLRKAAMVFAAGAGLTPVSGPSASLGGADTSIALCGISQYPRVMTKGDVIHRGQRVIGRAMVILFLVICAMTVLVAFLNKDPVIGVVLMAINLTIGGLVFVVLKLVRKITATLYGPPKQ